MNPSLYTVPLQQTNPLANVLNAMLGLVKIVLVKETIVMMISAMAIAGLTYGLLDMFMKPGLFFRHEQSKLDKNQRSRLFLSLLMILTASLPIIVVVSQATSLATYDRRSSFVHTFMESMMSIGASIIISSLMIWIFGILLRQYTNDPAIKKDKFPIGFAFSSVLHITGEHIADWIGNIITGIIDLGIRILHKPFVMEYAIVAVVLNLAFSFMLISIMGVSKDAGAANLLGSLIGGIAHYAIKNKEIAQLRISYTKSTAKRKRGNK